MEVPEKVMENKDRILVLAGGYKIDDMLVFLMFRKLMKDFFGKNLFQTTLINSDREEGVE